MFYTEIKTSRVDFRIFSIVSLVKKDRKTTFLIKTSVKIKDLARVFLHHVKKHLPLQTLHYYEFEMD